MSLRMGESHLLFVLFLLHTVPPAPTMPPTVHPFTPVFFFGGGGPCCSCFPCSSDLITPKDDSLDQSLTGLDWMSAINSGYLAAVCPWSAFALLALCSFGHAHPCFICSSATAAYQGPRIPLP